MNIIFMGNPEFAVPSLKAIVDAGYEVSAVVTNKDEPQGRGLRVLSPAVKGAADQLGLPVIQVSSPKEPGFVEKLKTIAPQVIVVVAFRILPPEVYSVAKLGTFNLHASLLPKYRGAAPVNWAIINGERETGVTTFFLDDKVDTGKIILQKETQIGENETAGDLLSRLSLIGSEAVVETLEKIGAGDVPLMEQVGLQSTKAPKINKEDCLVDWSKPASTIHNLIRGFSPEPGAYTFLGQKTIKMFRSRLAAERSVDLPGTVTIVNDRFLVACSDKMVEIVELQLEGKKKLSSAEFLRGARIESGVSLSHSK